MLLLITLASVRVTQNDSELVAASHGPPAKIRLRGFWCFFHRFFFQKSRFRLMRGVLSVFSHCDTYVQYFVQLLFLSYLIAIKSDRENIAERSGSLARPRL